jgi:hypothetical protein
LILLNALDRTGAEILRSTKTVSDIPTTTPASRYFEALRSKVSAGKLHYRLCNWYAEKRPKGFPLDVRFTGEDSLKFSGKFMHLIKALDGNATPHWRSVTFAYIGHQLRQSVSLFSKFSINPSEIETLKLTARKYFNASALFGKTSLTAWHIGFIAPLHVKAMYEKFGFGLGLNGMQGREAKHQRIKDYTKFTTHGKAKRWQTIFRHEYVHTIWLKENDDRKIQISSASKIDERFSFVKDPPESGESQTCLHCGFAVPCPYCRDEVYSVIDACVSKGYITERMKEFMNK